MNSTQFGKVHSILLKEVAQYKVPIVDLIKVQTEDPYKVLVTTIMSARTKDDTTSEAARRLFKRARSMSSLSKLTTKQIEKLIYPVGFYKTKAKHLKLLPSVLKQEFNGKIPQTVEELVVLPGVGRKTANLVVAVVFGKPAVCVDTHVHRIMNRLGFVKTKNPFKTEMVLRKKLPQKYWLSVNRILVTFGQNKCAPLSPHCSSCPIEKHCPRIGVKKSR